MQINRLIIPVRIAAMATVIIFSIACQSTETRHRNKGAPSPLELANAAYLGITDAPVTLIDGEWHGEPFVDASTSRLNVCLVRDFRLTGDLDGNGTDEAVVLLWTNSGGSGTFDYIAVVGRDRTGTPVNLATAALGDRVKIRAARIDAGRIIIDVVQAGSDDAACCPGQKVRRTFALVHGALTEVFSEDRGRQSVADLAGVEWTLHGFDRDTPFPDDIEVTLRFAGKQISGKSACNRYSGSVTEGNMPGELTVNQPLIGTRMACPPPADEIEQHYLEALQHISQYSFLAGNLALAWREDDRFGTMIFTPGRSGQNEGNDHGNQNR